MAEHYLIRFHRRARPVPRCLCQVWRKRGRRSRSVSRRLCRAFHCIEYRTGFELGVAREEEGGLQHLNAYIDLVTCKQRYSCIFSSIRCVDWQISCRDKNAYRYYLVERGEKVEACSLDAGLSRMCRQNRNDRIHASGDHPLHGLAHSSMQHSIPDRAGQ